MFPVFVADLGRGSPHLRSWPARESRPGCRPPAVMVALRTLCAGLLVAVAAAVAPAPEPMRRRLQSTTICAADLSGRTRGVPDGRVNVMDVRPLPPSRVCATPRGAVPD